LTLMRGPLFTLLICLALASPAWAQNLTLDYQEARITNTVISASGVTWQIEIRDVCSASVRRYEMSLICSEWRPLTAKGPNRQPAFKGEVELPDGKVVKSGSFE